MLAGEATGVEQAHSEGLPPFKTVSLCLDGLHSQPKALQLTHDSSLLRCL